MSTALRTLSIQTHQPLEIVDITALVVEAVERLNVRDGLVTVLSRHTTAYIAINENEAALRADMLEFLARLAPPGAGYAHDHAPLDGRKNAHAHLVGLTCSASQSIPLADATLLLGTWQSILFLELDGPRPEREVTVHVTGH